MNRRFFEIVLQIKRTCVKTEETIRSEFHISEAELNGLLAVHAGESISGSEFSKRMDLSPSRGSRVLARMVRRDFLKSVQIPENRRRVTISLTARGKRIKRDLEVKMETCGRSILERLPIEQRTKVVHSFDLLEKVFASKP